MQAPLKVGVIGLGDICDVYINNLKNYPELVEVTACASRGLEKAQAKAKQHGIAKAYVDGFELIADPEIDVILNLTPPNAHAALNRAALQADKHVYTEKPLAATFAEAQELVALAQQKQRRIASAPDTFMGGRLQTCRKLLDDGVIGDIVAVSGFMAYRGVESFHPSPDFFYKAGAGPLLDMGPYYMTAMLSLLGPVSSCCAMARQSFDKRLISSQPLAGQHIDVETETHITGNLQFASGALGTLITSFDVIESELPRLEIYGSKGTICLADADPLDGPNLFGGEVLLRTEQEYRWGHFPRDRQDTEWQQVAINRPFTSTSHAENSRGIGLVDMVQAIQQNRPERASGAMALHSLEVMEGMLISARERRFVDMETTFERPSPMGLEFPD